MRRVTTCTAIALAAAVVGGCKDMGLPDRNVPIEEARSKPPAPLVQVVKASARDRRQPVEILGRRYAAAGLELTAPESRFRPIGSADGNLLYALTWDAPPFDRVYLRAERASAWRDAQTGTPTWIGYDQVY